MELLRQAQQAAEELLDRDPELESCPAAVRRVRLLLEQSADAMN